jgi:hypothetical protein
MGKGGQVRGRQVAVTLAFRDSEHRGVRFGSWLRENSSALSEPRSISEKLRMMKLDNPAQSRLDTVLENCIFCMS